MTSVLIVEDEPPAARRLVRLAQSEPGIDEIQQVASLKETMEKLGETSFDIICLDLNLAGEDGFEVLSHMAAKGAAVIVVSAYLDRAMEGFEHGVVDFVPKPVSAERFVLALRRAQDVRPNDAMPRLALRRSGGVDLVPINEIVSISGAGDYAEIRVTSGQSYLDDRILKTFEELLSGQMLRVHRSHLVNRVFVRKLIKEGARVILEMEGGGRVPVARRALAKVNAALPDLGT